MSEALTIQLKGYDQSRVEEIVTDAIVSRLAEDLRSIADEKIAKAVNAQVDSVTQVRIQEAVDKVLAEGWQRTDEYGTPRGEKMTLKDRVSQILKETDRYNGNRSWLDQKVKETVEGFLHKDFADELAKAKDRFKKMVDESVMSSWLSVVKGALGMPK